MHVQAIRVSLVIFRWKIVLGDTRFVYARFGWIFHISTASVKAMKFFMLAGGAIH